MTGNVPPFRLSVATADVEAMPNVYAQFKKAPMFSIDVEGDDSVFVAMFPHLRDSIEDVLRLTQIIVGTPGLHARVNGRAVKDLALFWRALHCYRESLKEPIPTVHCARQARCAGDVAECEDLNRPIRCPFLGGACGRSEEGIHALSPRPRREALARRAEVDWCPNLQSAW